MESKFESLHHYFSNNPELDIINITETSQNINNETFKSNINLQGYSYYSTPSNSIKGGTIIYVKNSFEVTKRCDLSKTHDQYESTWIEINNKSSKNIICGSIYRHPHDNQLNFNNFLDYLETTSK